MDRVFLSILAAASVVGIGAFAGAMSSVIFQRMIGRILDANGQQYGPIFAVCGGAYLAAWAIIHFLVPRLQPAPIEAPGPLLVPREATSP